MPTIIQLATKIEKWPDDVDWHRKDDCRNLFGTDLGKCLKVSKLHGGRDTAEDLTPTTAPSAAPCSPRKFSTSLGGSGLAIVTKSPLPRVLTFARDPGWRRLPLLSTGGNTYDRDYFGDSEALARRRPRAPGFPAR